MPQSIGKEKSIGVIIARFQVAELHSGHRHLISYVLERHDKVVIILGVRGGARTQLNPLTFDERVGMIEQSIPEHKFTILKLEDHPDSSYAWSQSLDQLIDETFPDQEVVLYGARQSFIPHYLTKKFPTVEVVPVYQHSGTEERKKIVFPNTKEGREAIIHEQMTRWPLMHATSDIAIVNYEEEWVYMIGKKAHDGKLTFPGGHADKGDRRAINTAIREREEEVLNVVTLDPEPVDSISIDDPRYKGTPDGVMTNFFAAEYVSGEPLPGDDANDAPDSIIHKVYFSELLEKVASWHKPLAEALLQKAEQRKLQK